MILDGRTEMWTLLTLLLLLLTTDPLSDAFILGQLNDGSYVIVRQASCRHFVIFLSDVVCLDDRCKHWEAIRCVERAVVVVCVGPR